MHLARPCNKSKCLIMETEKDISSSFTFWFETSLLFSLQGIKMPFRYLIQRLSEFKHKEDSEISWTAKSKIGLRPRTVREVEVVEGGLIPAVGHQELI